MWFAITDERNEMTERDKLHLGYLAKSRRPLWGGHLERGEPITDPDMQRWLDEGLIERVGETGYLATAKCKQLLQQKPGA